MPTPTHQFGQAGEAAAAAHLVAQGYTIVQRNYRFRRAEIDLIAQLNTTLLVFVEVKARSTSKFGYPEAFVTERKRQLFRLAAEQMQEELDWHGDIRFDVLAVTPVAAGFRVEHFEDAFY